MTSTDSSARTAIHVAPATTQQDWAHAKRLTGELVQWLAETLALDARVHQHDSNEELDSLATFYTPPRGEMLLGYVGGTPCGTSGVFMMDESTAELRRVWITPSARGHRLAPVLLQTAIESARRMGARRMWLETAQGHMDKAIAMYTRAGFRPVPKYSTLSDNIPNILTLGLDLS